MSEIPVSFCAVQVLENLSLLQFIHGPMIISLGLRLVLIRVIFG